MLSTCDDFPAQKPFKARQAIGILLAFILTMIFATDLGTFTADQLFNSNKLHEGDDVANTGNEGAVLVLGQLAGVIAAAAVMICLLRFYFPGSIRQGALAKIGVAKCSTKWGVWAGLSGFFFSLICVRVLGPMFPPNEDFVPNPLQSSTQTGDWVQFLMVVMVVCVAPPVEELLFRGVLYKGLSESWGKLRAGFCIFALFIVVHNETLSGGYWLSMTALVFISAFLLAIREMSDSLIPSILMHSGFNFALVLPS